MEIRLRVLRSHDLLSVNASGDIDYQDARRLLRVLEERDATEQLPVLVDVRETSGGLQMLDLQRLVKELEASPLLKRRRLALLVRNDGQLVRGKFLEAHAGDRTFPLQAFTDFEEAARWLATPP
jgi:hypothetical protein